MTASRPHAPGGVDRRLQHRRDAAFARVRRITKATAIAMVAALGAVTAYISSAIPGRSAPPAGASTAPTSPPSTPAPGTAPTTPSPSNALAPPAVAPAPAPRARAPVQSTTS